MPNKFSIVIVCKNAAEGIGRTLGSIRGLSDDVLVYDSGSGDGTIELVESLGYAVHCGPWLGFGATRRAATELAKYDWVLCLDADEWLDAPLAEELLSLEPAPGMAYRLRLRNHLGERPVRWGAWGSDYRLRLFDRRACNWNEALIHEKVIAQQPLRIETLRGAVLHQTARNIADYRSKLDAYARLVAESYRAQGRKATVFRRTFSPLVTFLKDYVFKLGFLEGKVGFQLAWAMAGYTRKKYALLAQQKKVKSGFP